MISYLNILRAFFSLRFFFSHLIFRGCVIFAALAFFICFPAKLRAQSSLDGFDPNPNNTVNVIFVQPDGKILIGGDFTTVAPNGGNAVTRNRIARFNADGSLDTAFAPNLDGSVYSITMQKDGKILIGGRFTTVFAQKRNAIARLDAATGMVDSFNANVNGQVFAIAVQPDGKILVGGTFSSAGGQARNNIARVSATNGLADSFTANTNYSVRAIALMADGRVLIGGEFTTVAGQAKNRIAQLNATTGQTETFNPSPDSIVRAIAVLPDTKIIIGGHFTTIQSKKREKIALVDALTGVPYTLSWGDKVDGNVHSIALQPDGKILVAGDFTTIGGQKRNRIARLDAATGLADSFNPDADNYVWSIAAQADGRILVAGDFAKINGQTRNRVARLLAFAPSISGKVLDASGAPIAQAGATLTDLQGKTRVVYTDASGIFKFTDAVMDSTYIVSVYDTRYRFTPQLITIKQSATDLTFKAQ